MSIQTVVAVSIRQIICNSLITGVIRDNRILTIIAYTSSITTIVSNLHIFRSVTTIIVGTATRSFSNDGIFHIATRKTIVTGIVMNGGIFHPHTRFFTLTRSFMNDRILYRLACGVTVTRNIIDSTIWYSLARIFTVTRAIAYFDVVCLKTSKVSLCEQEVEYETEKTIVRQ